MFQLLVLTVLAVLPQAPVARQAPIPPQAPPIPVKIIYDFPVVKKPKRSEPDCECLKKSDRVCTCTRYGVNACYCGSDSVGRKKTVKKKRNKRPVVADRALGVSRRYATSPGAPLFNPQPLFRPFGGFGGFQGVSRCGPGGCR